MKRPAVLALALAALLAAVPGAAHAGPPVGGPTGQLCSFFAVDAVGSSRYQGVLTAGPIAAVDQSGNVYSGTLTCSIQANSAIHSGENNDATSASAHITGGGGLLHVPLSYMAPADDPIYLCSQFEYDSGTTLYFHASDDPSIAGHWSTEPYSTCGLATSLDGGDVLEPLRPLCEWVGLVFNGTIAGVVTVEPDGDVWVAGTRIWSCAAGQGASFHTASQTAY